MNTIRFSNFLLLLVVIFGIHYVNANKYSNCMSTTDDIYTLPDTKLSILNTFLAKDKQFQNLIQQACPTDRDDGVACPDKPAIGSGIAQLDKDHFLSLTDRGPNQNCEDLYKIDPIKYKNAKGKKGKGFPIISFAPTISYFQLDQQSKHIVMQKQVTLKDSRAVPISGISNTKYDDTPYGFNCEGNPLKLDPSGLDPEDMAIIPGTDYVAIADEYSPSVVLANYKTGIILKRHVPKSMKKKLKGIRYPIKNDLPDIYMNRRKNRGFEGIVVDKNAKYVIAILQSPMLSENEENSKNNQIIRCAYFKLKIDDGKPKLKYSYTFIIEASPISAFENEKNDPKDIKYSAAHHYEQNKFIALERAKGQVKLFMIDFSSVTKIDQTKYKDNLQLEIETNGIYTAQQKDIIAAEKTLIWDSANVVGGSIGFNGDFKQESFTIDINDNSKIWMMNDNDFGLERNDNAKLLKISLGRSLSGTTVCQLPEHPKAPIIDVNPSKTIKLTNSKTYRVTNQPGIGSAENFDVNEKMKRAYVANDNTGKIDMYDLSVSPVKPISSFSIDGPYKPTSASVCKINNMVAAGFANSDDEAAPSRIEIFSGKDLSKIQTITHDDCILSDSVKWSNDCSFLVVACEGEGAKVPGGILIADFNGPKDAPFRGVKVATFDKYDTIVDIVKENGIHLPESGKPSLDFEPEYVSFHGKNAFIVLQENNAIAVVDLYEAKITEIKPIGFIDRSRTGFALDASDKDDGIHIRNYPRLYGMPQPDTLATYTAGNGETYLVFSNEGDAKDPEEFRAADIIDPKELNRKIVAELKPLIEDKKLLGRIKFSSVRGFNAATNTQENIFHFGSRSFSIMALNGTIVFDSGEWFARIQEKHFPKIFNSNSLDDEELSKSQADLFDNRSDDKGAEPESLSVMTHNGKNYAFIGLERPSIIVVFDITDPTAPVFVDAVQNHPFNDPIEKVFAEGRQGDLDPEGIFASSKLMKLYVAGSVSSTVTSWNIEA